jgi:uncharacterized protein
MVIDLKKIKRSGKESQDFFFLYAPKTETLDIPGAEFKEEVKVNGTVTLTGEHSAFIEGEVVFTIVADCTRCLTRTEQDYLVEFSESVDQDDEEGYPVKNDTVDLTRIVDDLILMNNPISFLCKEDCLGICPDCGVNLNQDQCKCKNK